MLGLIEGETDLDRNCAIEANETAKIGMPHPKMEYGTNLNVPEIRNDPLIMIQTAPILRPLNFRVGVFITRH